jgi:hypothetical protein
MLKIYRNHFYIVLLSLIPACLFYSCDKANKTGSLTWVLKDGTLTISGRGPMPDYRPYNSPWTHQIRGGDPTITSIIIKKGVTTIGDNAFTDCLNVISVSIPPSVSRIGKNAFGGCEKITSIIIPDSVHAIGESAFYNCKGLTSVTLGKSVESIGLGAFDGCDSIRSGASTDPVKEGKRGNFSWILKDGILSISGNGEMPDYESYQTPWTRHIFGISSIIINDGVSAIGNSAFYGCQNVVSVSIPDSVNRIGSYAFNNCTQLSSITLPPGLVELGDKAFMGCPNLLEIKSLNPTPIVRREITREDSYLDEDGIWVFVLSLDEEPFDEETFNNTALYVPGQSIQEYSKAPMWKNFKTIRPLP